jgi:hypothetical protein
MNEELFRNSIPGEPPLIFRGIVKRKYIHNCINKGEDFYLQTLVILEILLVRGILAEIRCIIG